MKLSLFAKALIMPILITSFLLFNGCSTTSSFKWSDDDLPTLYGIVIDANTNTPIDSVMISWMDDRDSLGLSTVYTDDNGYYKIENLNFGNYLFTVYKDSTYATVLSTKTINPVSAGEGTESEGGLVDDYRYENHVSMYMLNAGVSGTVNKIVNDSKSPADTVTVTINLSSTLVPQKYTTTTDNMGRYSFTNLPATGSNTTLTVLPHNDGTNDFASTTANVTLLSGATLANQNLSITENEGTVYVSSNNIETGVFGINDNITVLFSHAMDSASVEIGLLQSSTNIPIDFSWTNEYNLVIDPDAPFAYGTTYALSITGFATDGAALSWLSNSFSTIAYDGIILVSSSVKSDGGSSTANVAVNSNIELTFNKAPDLTVSGTSVTLTNSVSSKLVDIAVTASGNTLTINPVRDLAIGQAHVVTYTIFSMAGDVVSSTQGFTTVSNAIAQIYTNLNDYQMGEFPVASDIKILFSETPSITNANTSVRLSDEDASGDPVVAVALSVSGDTLIINPDGNLRNDINYEVTYTVYTAAGGDSDGDGACDVGDSCETSHPDFKTTVGYTAVPGAVTFSMDTTTMKALPVTNAAGNFAADYNDKVFSFSWPTIDNADNYVIYAKDNLHNPNYVAVLDVSDQDDETIQTENVTLPAQFDRLTDDSGTFGQTPLAGITVTFVITAYNDIGEGAQSNAITITDTDEPAAPSTSNTTCNNTSASATLTCTVTHTYTEIMDVSITPTAAITGTLSSATVTHAWDEDGNVGTFTITVPVSTNGTTDTFTVDKSTVKDLSGNVLSSDWSETL